MNTVTLEIPVGFDQKVINDWIGGDEILEQETTDTSETFCVLVKDEEGERRFLRFFLGGGETHCSVDWDEGSGSTQERLFDIMFRRFTN